jgi:hypothetical protein
MRRPAKVPIAMNGFRVTSAFASCGSRPSYRKPRPSSLFRSRSWLPNGRCLLPQAVGRWVLAVTAHPKIRLGFMTGEILDLTQPGMTFFFPRKPLELSLCLSCADYEGTLHFRRMPRLLVPVLSRSFALPARRTPSLTFKHRWTAETPDTSRMIGEPAVYPSGRTRQLHSDRKSRLPWRPLRSKDRFSRKSPRPYSTERGLRRKFQALE